MCRLVKVQLNQQMLTEHENFSLSTLGNLPGLHKCQMHHFRTRCKCYLFTYIACNNFLLNGLARHSKLSDTVSFFARTFISQLRNSRCPGPFYRRLLPWCGPALTLPSSTNSFFAVIDAFELFAENP